MSNYVSLHNHTQHSYLDGIGNAAQWISKAKELGMPAIAITDHGGVNGCLEWQRECDKQKMGCILGAECYIVPEQNIKQPKEQRGHIVILVKDIRGWQTLCRLLTQANLNGFYHRPRIDFNSLLNADLSGFIILTACVASFVNLPNGIKTLIKLQDKMKGNLFLEIEPHDFSAQYKHNKKIFEIHNKLNIPLVATNDCHYIEKDDWETQEILLAIQTKAKLNDKKRFKFSIKGLYLKTRREMQLAFRRHCFTSDQVNAALDNTIKIAEMCKDFRIHKQEISLPSPYENIDSDKFLESLCVEWFKENGLLDREGDRKQFEIYMDRFHKEFKLISSKKFSRYFLIFYDLIRWCKKEKIPVGPGRGSAGGSLIAFLIGITKIDPIYHHLSFARFLQEDRIDFPDIDCDFAKKDRDKVRQYLVDKYGENYTCGISTDMKLKSKAAVQAVARVFEVPEKDIRAFSSSIWQSGDEKALQSTIEDKGKWFAEKYPKVIKFALKLENQTRGQGQHAAALVVSSKDLTQGTKCVLIRRKDRIVCNWDMESSEYVGLMKLDILGLSTLSVLDETERLINDIPLERFNLDNIPLDDKKVFDLINSGKTAGMFQISAKPTTELCKEMKINSFENIVAAIALVRPGPSKSGMTKDFIKRKHGEKWNAIHPIYEEITKYTYGIVVYQEQIMAIIHKVAGLPESTADRIRKVIAKKRTAIEFEPYKKQFVEGCKKQKTLSKKEAEVFWEALKEHANYSFNRSHSVAYAMIGYQTAWLKANYPVEFICACLTYADYDNNKDEDARQKKELLEEITEHNITIMPPKVGISDPIKWLIKDNKLYIPFIEIKGTGEHQAKKCAISKSISKPKLQGFFGKKYAAPQKEKSKIELVLEELKAYDLNAIPNKNILLKHFPFDIN